MVGPPGIGKEALGYWLLSSALNQGDFAFYLTKRAAREVMKDADGFGVDLRASGSLYWIR